MLGRTNALVRPLVSSVNGMTGTVILNANIQFNTSETYEENTIGEYLKDVITDVITEEQIENLFA